MSLNSINANIKQTDNLCKCYITPRKKYSNTKNDIDFINTCRCCLGNGGNYGNVYHLINCEYRDCIHSDNYFKGDQFKLFYADINRLDNRWSNYQPDLSTRIIHSNFSKNLKDQIIKKIIEFDNKLNRKTLYMINLKTNKKIF